MRKTVPVVALLLAGCFNKSEPEPVLFGQIVPLSGPEQYIGDHARQGLVLAVEEANKEENRLLGRRVAVLTPDAGGSADAIRQKAVRLVTVDRSAALLGGTALDQLEGLAPVAQSHHVPVVIGSGYAWRSVNDYVFRTGLSPGFHGQALARLAVQEKLSRVLVLADATETRAATSSALTDAFARELKKGGGHVLGEVRYQNTGGFKDFCARMQEKNPRALLFAGPLADLDLLRKAGLDRQVPLLFAGEDGSSKRLLTDTGVNVVYLATAWVSDSGWPRAGEFVKKYQERFADPPDVHAALAFDNANLLFAAIRQAKSLDRSKIRDALADGRNFDSLTGTFSFTKDLWASRPAFLVRIENGQAKTIKTIDPDG